MLNDRTSALSLLATRRSGAIKQPFVSPFIARLGLAGMYVPFTGEATIVHGMPAIRTPMSMAHEKAHQRGIAREWDANFLAFVAASSAADPLSRYAAGLFAQQQLYGELTRFATERELRRIHGLRAAGVVMISIPLSLSTLGLPGSIIPLRYRTGASLLACSTNQPRWNVTM